MSHSSSGAGSKEISKHASAKALSAGNTTSATSVISKSVTSGKPGGDEREREKMISVAAYFRSEHRGFNGDPIQDWLTAEAEIDAMLNHPEDANLH